METMIIDFDNTINTGTYAVNSVLNIKNQNFIYLTLSGAKYNDVTFENVIFNTCNIQASNFSNCNFVNCKFVDCTFSFSSMKNCNFLSSTIKGCSFTVTKATESEFFSCAMVQNEMIETDFDDSKNTTNTNLLVA